MCISSFIPSSSPSNSFAMLLIHSAFCYVHLVAIFYFRIVPFPLHSVVGICSCHLPQILGRIFIRCFGMICFVCIVLPFVEIVFQLPSIANTFWFISFVVSLFFLVLRFPLFDCFCVFVFFICLSSQISHPGFDFLFVLFRETLIFSQTNLAPA